MEIKKAENSWIKIFKIVGLVLIFLLFLYATLLLSFKYFEAVSEREVPTPPIPILPVFVTLQDKYSIEQITYLEIVQRENPNYSFLVKTENLDTINRELVEEYGSKNRDIPQLTVEQNSVDKQIVTVFFSTDGLLEHRYEATEKEIKPLTYKLQGPGFVFGPCAVTAIFGLIVFCLFRFILWYLRKKHKTNLGN